MSWAHSAPAARRCLLAAALVAALPAAGLAASGASPGDERVFPLPLESYGDSRGAPIWQVLKNRIEREPLNLWVTIIFLCAIVHSFLTDRFIKWSHRIEERRKSEAQAGGQPAEVSASMAARFLHFLGEVEAVFGIWCVPLFILLAGRRGWDNAVRYFSDVSYVEPVFVVVIMAIASTRPILVPAEGCMRALARLGHQRPAAWWLSILTLGPVLGSLITEPAAMTISALLLGKQFYAFRPSPRLAYGTLGLLFVNISVGGVLTHFAAPPVLMVAGPWGWSTPFMFLHFGWVALAGIAVSNTLYFLVLRRDFARLEAAPVSPPDAGSAPAMKAWITLTHLAFMAWFVITAHYPALLIGGFLFFLAFFEATKEFQGELQLRSPLLVGFFLAGLVLHGGLQEWWIAPTLSGLTEVPLLLGAAGLTAFNDNAAITYLATLVPDLSDPLKHAVVAGAVAGGGLTVIANAPNPAGQSILARFFPAGIAPLGLLLGALPATVIMVLGFIFLR